MYFAIKLNPPRPDFAQSMNEEEREVMQMHAQYWKAYMNKGKVIVFGPVLNEKETYGFGVVKVENEEELKSFIINDPAVKIMAGYDFSRMLAVVPESIQAK